MQTRAGRALVPTLSGGSEDDSAQEQETPTCVTVSIWPGRQEILCGIGQGWCRKGLRRPANLTPSFCRLEKRGQGSVSELNLMTLKHEETVKNEGPGKQSKAVGGKILECQIEDPQKSFQLIHFTDRETEAPRGH